MVCRSYAAATGGGRGWVGERVCGGGVCERWRRMVGRVVGGCRRVGEERGEFREGIIFCREKSALRKACDLYILKML